MQDEYETFFNRFVRKGTMLQVYQRDALLQLEEVER
jgi:hypothetical protein